MKSYIKNLNGLILKFILISLIAGIVSSGGVVIFGSSDFGLNNMYTTIFLMFGVIFFLFRGRKLYNKNIKNIKSLPFGKKLNAHQLACKDRARSFAMISIIASLGLAFTGNFIYLIFVGFSVLLLGLNWMTPIKLKIELSLSDKEINSLTETL